MYRAIWKFHVLPDAFTVEMPAGARILSVATQPGEMEPFPRQAWGTDAHPRMWALVDPAAATVKRRFVCVGTGQHLPAEIDGFALVGAFQIRGGSLRYGTATASTRAAWTMAVPWTLRSSRGLLLVAQTPASRCSS